MESLFQVKSLLGLVQTTGYTDFDKFFDKTKPPRSKFCFGKILGTHKMLSAMLTLNLVKKKL
jgi:hypothetical protein